MITVTFDKNVYEYVVDPAKPGNITADFRIVYQEIHKLIRSGLIKPLISETILTYETIRKADRQTVLACFQPMISAWEGNDLHLSPNPARHTGMSSFDLLYLPMAIDLGFEIIPDHRFGKLTHPTIKSKWYYRNADDFFAQSDKFEEVDSVLRSFGVGYSAFANLIGYKPGTGAWVSHAVAAYNGKYEKLSKSLSERSDGDSVALHIAYNIDFFCTNDRGVAAGRSVFNPDIVAILMEKYHFRKGDPVELLSFLRKQ